MLSDHLGTTHVITNSNDVSEQVMSFDVFGARRDAQREVGLENAVAVSGHAIGYHTHPSGRLEFSNLENESRGYASDTKWVRNNHKHLYVGAMQGSVVKISICEYQSACMSDVRMGGALGRSIQ
jgi:hypothetical protein